MFCFGAPCWRPRRLHPLATAMGSHCLEEQRLTLRVSQNTTGYFGVSHLPGRFKRYQARVKRGGKDVHLGSFVTAEEAALCVAQTPEGRAAAQAKRAGQSAPSLTSEEARQQAQAEGLTLRVAENQAGYFGVSLNHPGCPKPYQAQVWSGGKTVNLGNFATAEQAALCVARSPEGRAAAERAASVPQPRGNEEDGQGNAPATRSRATLKEEAVVPPMPAGAFVKEEELQPMPPGAFVKEEVVVKREHEAVVEGGRSEGRGKRRRA